MTAHLPSVTVGFSEGLVIDYARKNGISLLIKGYRNEIDLAYEKTQADWNLQNGGIETRILPAIEGQENISSTAARAALLSGKNEALLCESVFDFIKKREKT